MTDDLNITIFRTLSITLLLCITGPKITLLPVLALIIAQVGTFNIYKNELYLQALIGEIFMVHFVFYNTGKLHDSYILVNRCAMLCIDSCITSINGKKYDYSSFSIFLLVVSQCPLMLVYFVFVLFQPEIICDKYWENLIIPA